MSSVRTGVTAGGRSEEEGGFVPQRFPENLLCAGASASHPGRSKNKVVSTSMGTTF